VVGKHDDLAVEFGTTTTELAGPPSAKAPVCLLTMGRSTSFVLTDIVSVVDSVTRPRTRGYWSTVPEVSYSEGRVRAGVRVSMSRFSRIMVRAVICLRNSGPQFVKDMTVKVRHKAKHLPSTPSGRQSITSKTLDKHLRDVYTFHIKMCYTV